MLLLPLIELLTGLAALLFAGAAFINLTWSEGASSQTMKRDSARRTRRRFAVTAVLGLICVACAYLSMR